MHKFLRAIGFSKIQTKMQEILLLNAMERSPGYGGPDRERHEHAYAEVRCPVEEEMGVILHGFRDEKERFFREFYFPYLMGRQFMQLAGGYVRRHGGDEAYAVLCEEYELGSALIFHLINGIEYREREEKGENTELHGYYLSGLSVKGTILLPIRKTEKQIAQINANTRARSRMMEAAREGDEDAMESLTMDDINLYSQISRRMLKEDIYSIVDSCFMPSGVECDNYMIIGEITDCVRVENQMTQEKVWRLQVTCNGLDITVCINEKDLLGEPAVGRRFKGDIWLQGYGIFTDELP